ncbi:hypothetical protein PMAYCL1PPCAC_09358 [Pristionchus mayeri]|uniref:Uncharacterized protein n=1 Tax=Pristionchus mayeri TaxID=1317129 RepID=A0AAN4ZIU2_9BILA|nr:hypothetical protein PMAYCL1PPCAC_09358 [Pristionchus mayeri]
MYDDPIRKNIPVDLSGPEMENASLLGIHRDMVIYRMGLDAIKCPVIKQVTENVILLECGKVGCNVYNDDSTPLLYISYISLVFVLDTRTMEFLPPLEIEGYIIYYIVNVNNGIMTMKLGKKGHSNEECSATATLPFNYFEPRDEMDQLDHLTSAMQQLDDVDHEISLEGSLVHPSNITHQISTM